jgi:hypothetical protein
MKKIYLETTMFNFLHVSDIPGYREYKADVARVFELIKAGQYAPYTSLYAIGEIEDTKNPEKRAKMEKDVAGYQVTILPASNAAIRLAALYIEAGAVPSACPTDAAHIAMTAVYGLDFIVSLNFEHIEAVPKLQFWNSNLRFKGKSEHLIAFSKSLFQNQRGFGTSSPPFLLSGS